MRIDLRSDTVTKPSQAMLDFMQQAKVGDDVFEEDPTINQLQQLTAEMFGKEAALFCPSGTMSNQIAIKAQTQPGDEVICDEGAHIHYHEGGGIAFNSGASTNPLSGTRGVFTAQQVKTALRPANIYFAQTTIVSIENTCNRGGGKIFDFQEIQRIRQVCSDNKLKLHLDGARLFNAIVEVNRSPIEYGAEFDSISICLSKGLGAPVGSLLIGSNDLIQRAYRIRKVLGGGMRQAGYLAAAGIYALNNNVTRLAKDHQLAKEIGTLLREFSFVKQVLEPETNILVFELERSVSTSDLIHHLQEESVFAFEVGPQQIRFVTHLDLPSDTLEKLRSSLARFKY